MSFDDDDAARFTSRETGPWALDEATASRLLDGRVEPADAPPGYAAVATVLRTAAAPGRPDELAGDPAALAAFARAATGRRSRLRSTRLAALIAAGVVVLGGVAAAATGALPSPAQSAAREAFGVVGVSIPAPVSPARTASPHAGVITPAPAPRAARPGSVRTPTPSLAPIRPGGSRAASAPPRPTTPPAPAGHRADPAILVRACQAYAAGRLAPTGTRPAVGGYQALARLAGGAAQIGGYCHTVLGR